jgi:N-acetylmuramoyl-L-alanine amidase
MRKQKPKRLVVRVIVLAMVFYLTARPTLNAADPASMDQTPRSLAEKLFQHANTLSGVLHNKPFEERNLSEYRLAMDSFNQVVRLNTDTHYSAESLARIAELQREMADSSGDSALYQQAIETFRRITTEHPNSAFVGDSLIQTAQIYEENLQDLDGAARAYREMIDHFPSSVLAREARAVLARFEAQLRNRPVDVVVPLEKMASEETALEGLRITNARNFSGPDYARVVIDLSGEASFAERRAGDGRLSIQIAGASVSPSLYHRRFIVGQSTLLKRIVISESGAASTIDIDVGSLAEYSTFSLTDPARIVIDLHGANSIARAKKRESALAARSEATEARESKPASAVAPTARVARSASGKPIYGLPEINDPILLMGPEDTKKSEASKSDKALTEKLAEAVESKSSDSPIRCIVIDPGHGGHDTGTISSAGMREKDLTLDVARRLRAYIKRNYPDIEVVMTRESDRFVALEERTAIANSRAADLFISVHANASAKRAASGVETFFVSPDRAGEAAPPATAEAKPANQTSTDKAQPMFASVTVGNRVAASRELARYIQSGLVRGIGAHSPNAAANRGVKHAPFAVLRGSAMPSVLAEVSFLSNPRDEALLQTSQFRERIAASLFAGLNAYLKKNRSSESQSKK